jgi:hypothetical protein
MNLLILFIYALPFAIVGFIFEAYPRFINRYIGIDIWTHLLYLQEYHKQKGIPKEIKNGFIVSGVYDYPPAFIYILSKFPVKYIKKYEFVFSPFFDAIFLIIIFLTVFYLTQNIFISFLTQILYLLTPIIILENSSATPRSLGYMLFTLIFLSIFIFENSHNYFLLVFAIIAGSFVFLSHRFTTQAFLFFALFFSIITLNMWYIVVFIFSFIFASILSKGFYFKVMHGHLGNLKFWRDNIKYRFAHQVRGITEQHKTNDFVFRLYNQFLRFPPFVLSIANPWVISAFYFSLFIQITDPVIFRLSQVILLSYLLALFTIWIPGLRFLGEGQRYLELSAFPTALLSALLLQKFFMNEYILTVYGAVGMMAFITIIAIQRKAIIKDKFRTLTPNLKIMFSYLKSLKTKPKLFVIPHQMTTSTIYHTGCPVFVNADYATINKISDVYPYIKKPIREIMKKHRLDLIFLNSDYATISELKIGSYKKIYEVGNYVLLKII